MPRKQLTFHVRTTVPFGQAIIQTSSQCRKIRYCHQRVFALGHDDHDQLKCSREMFAQVLIHHLCTSDDVIAGNFFADRNGIQKEFIAKTFFIQILTLATASRGGGGASHEFFLNDRRTVGPIALKLFISYGASLVQLFVKNFDRVNSGHRAMTS